jgi:hypothetical protein
MAAQIAETTGRTVAQHLDFLYEQYGFHAGRQGEAVQVDPRLIPGWTRVGHGLTKG